MDYIQLVIGLDPRYVCVFLELVSGQVCINVLQIKYVFVKFSQIMKTNHVNHVKRERDSKSKSRVMETNIKGEYNVWLSASK